MTPTPAQFVRRGRIFYPAHFAGRASRKSPLLTNLVSYWKLDEASGTRLDSHGTNHLADVNTVGSVAGKVGNAASFISANEEALTLADNPSISIGPNQDFTFTCWVKLASKTGLRRIANKSNDQGFFEWALRYDNGVDRFRLSISDSGTGTNVFIITTGTSPSTATWYFLACWLDMTARTLNIQQDNGTVNTTDVVTGVGNWDSGFDLWLGHRISAAGQGWDGEIDECGFWKRTLTASERTQLFGAGTPPPYPWT